MEKIKTVTQQHPKPNLFHVKIPDVQDSFPFWPFDPDFQGTKDLQNPSLVPVAMLLPRSSSSHSNHTEAQPAKPYRQFETTETTETTCPAVYLKDWSLEGPWIYRMCYVQCMCVTVCVCIYRVCACVWHIWLVEIMQLHHIVTSGEHSCSIGLIAGHNTFWLSFTRLGTLVYNFSIYFFGIFLSISPHPPLAPPKSLRYLLFFATEFYHSATQLLRHHVLASTHKGPHTAGKFAGTRLAWRSDVNVAVCTFRRNLNVKSIHIYIYIYIYIYMCVYKNTLKKWMRIFLYKIQNIYVCIQCVYIYIHM